MCATLYCLCQDVWMLGCFVVCSVRKYSVFISAQFSTLQKKQNLMVSHVRYILQENGSHRLLYSFNVLWGGSHCGKWESIFGKYEFLKLTYVS